MSFPLVTSLLTLLVLLFCSAWISSAETALFSLSSHKLKSYRHDRDPTRRLIAQLLSHPRDLLVTVFMINTFVNIILQNVASDMFGLESGWGLKVGIPLLLTLVFGEIIPKYIGLQNNVSIAHRAAPAVEKLQDYLSWIRKMFIAITTPISRIMFFFLRKEKGISKEEIEHVLETSLQHGVLSREESDLLSGYLRFQDSFVKELMRPKEEILFYDIAQPLSKLIYLFIEEGYTRVPVCQKSLDVVLGIISLPEFYTIQNALFSPSDLIPHLTKPFYVPETTPAKVVLKRLDEHGDVLALVVDEYGTITGLISREDLIEKVIGQIEDAKDQVPLFIKAGKNEVIASGKWELSEFNEYFHSTLESVGSMVTIGGWLTEQVGEIPKSGSKYDLQGFHFKILASNPKRITRIFIRKQTSKPT